MESALKKDVWVVDDSIISPLGSTSEENFNNVVKSVSGIRKIKDDSLASTEVHVGRIDDLSNSIELTRFEQMCVAAIDKITERHSLRVGKTLFILSTTKGNIDLLKSDSNHSRLHLHSTAKHIAQHSGLENTLVVSNACISGVMAIAIAKRYLERGQFDHAMVVGADELTNFVVSGFQSLGALSNEICRPFDRDRNGINLGEAAAAILLTTKPEQFSQKPSIKILGSGLSNDANHISGPSRTGEELALAIAQALHESSLTQDQIDFISAHGTATLYNDEMEAKAFNLSGFSRTPLHSLKGYYGHTLGAAGVLELIISIHGLKNNTLIPSLGYTHPGVSQELNVITQSVIKPMTTFLKTASGFGGCNAAMVVQKQN
ncbi:MAG TPA: beta-ketoacyl synthase N-terminal-like domain-containing protein [Chryseosolibacter sp.]